MKQGGLLADSSFRKGQLNLPRGILAKNGQNCQKNGKKSQLMVPRQPLVEIFDQTFVKKGQINENCLVSYIKLEKCAIFQQSSNDGFFPF